MSKTKEELIKENQELKRKIERLEFEQEKFRSQVARGDFRIRKQCVVDFRGKREPYYFSIRAVTLNPEVNEQQLKMAVMKAIRRLRINTTGFQRTIRVGFEREAIGRNEERKLNNEDIYIEYQEKRTIVERFKI
jgi:hypothetical protein